jgi:hypothetical protein
MISFSSKKKRKIAEKSTKKSESVTDLQAAQTAAQQH